jgi:hypothetical protein
MPNIKVTLNAKLSWDLLMCEVVFGNNGIQLNTTMYPGKTPDLSKALSKVSKKTQAAAIATPLFSKLARSTSKPDRKAFQMEVAKRRALTKDWGGIATIGYKPQIIKVSTSRATQLVFFTTSSEWLFDPPGLFLDSPLDPAIGAIGVPQIVDYGHTVWTTFVPQNVATQFKYNLRLITSVWNNGAFDGHAIIIVDPIIETSKQ